MHGNQRIHFKDGQKSKVLCHFCLNLAVYESHVQVGAPERQDFGARGGGIEKYPPASPTIATPLRMSSHPLSIGTFIIFVIICEIIIYELSKYDRLQYLTLKYEVLVARNNVSDYILDVKFILYNMVKI